MESKPLFATITAFVALFLALLALFELHAPRGLLSTFPTGLDARLSQLEGTVALQRDTLSRLEAQRAGPDSREDIRRLRDGTQQSLNQVSREVGQLRAQVNALQQAVRNIGSPAPEVRPASPSPEINPSAISHTYLVIHTVPGDTLASLAKRWKTTEEAVKAANPGVDFTQLVPGQRIIFPLP